ncbi:MAG: hypothetical protein NTW59_04445 [Candidatus Diapherotrites archaeon]|nr:hypothetical protein [Candidatus Diapherotrites archaeon]
MALGLLERIGARRFWARMRPRERAQMLKAMRARVRFRHEMRAIGANAHALGIPKEKLLEHFQLLERQGVKRGQLAETVMRQLQQMKEMTMQAGISREEMAEAFKSHGFSDVLTRMQQMSQQPAMPVEE